MISSALALVVCSARRGAKAARHRVAIFSEARKRNQNPFGAAVFLFGSNGVESMKPSRHGSHSWFPSAAPDANLRIMMDDWRVIETV